MYSTLKILNHLHGYIHRRVFLFVCLLVCQQDKKKPLQLSQRMLFGSRWKNIRCIEVADTKRGLLGLGGGMRSAECCSCLNQYLPKWARRLFYTERSSFIFCRENDSACTNCWMTESLRSCDQEHLDLKNHFWWKACVTNLGRSV